jgi:hypothetical protein
VTLRGDGQRHRGVLGDRSRNDLNEAELGRRYPLRIVLRVFVATRILFANRPNCEISVRIKSCFLSIRFLRDKEDWYRDELHGDRKCY